MKKTLEQQIQEQEIISKHLSDKISGIISNLKLPGKDEVLRAHKEYIKLLELKLKLSESKTGKDAMIENAVKNINEGYKAINKYFESISTEQPNKEKYVRVSKGCPIVGFCDKICDNCCDTTKEKTLDDYCDEYMTTQGKSPNIIRIKATGLTFEESCGLLKYICRDVDKEFNPWYNLGYYIGKGDGGNYRGEDFNFKVSPFILHTKEACGMVVKICGTEFLDRIFKA